MAHAMLLGDYSPPAGVLQPLATAGWLACLAAVLRLQRLQIRLEREEPTHWWASSGRDGVNLFALVLMVGALALMGFTLPAAFLLGASILVPLLVASSPAIQRGHPALVATGLALVLGLPVAVAPARVHRLLVDVVSWLER